MAEDDDDEADRGRDRPNLDVPGRHDDRLVRDEDDRPGDLQATERKTRMGERRICIGTDESLSEKASFASERRRHGRSFPRRLSVVGIDAGSRRDTRTRTRHHRFEFYITIRTPAAVTTSGGL